MIIKNIYRDKKENTNGLKIINLYDLKKVVILTGPNGSGKTRLLDTIYEMCSGYIKCKKEISSIRTQLESDKSSASRGASGAFSIQIDESQYYNKISKLEREITEQYNIQLSNSSITKFGIIRLEKEIYDEIKSPNDFKLNEIKEIFNKSKNLGFSDIYNNVYIILFYLFTQLFVKGHSSKTPSEIDVKSVDKQVNDISNLISKNLGLSISYTDDDILFDGYKIDTLSLGQKIILKLSIASYYNNINLDECIVLYDEPENYLHPKAIIDMLDSLNKSLGQIWIATHNISIVSHYYNQSLCFMINGIIKQSGYIQKEVLNTLLGNNSSELRIFIEEPYNFSFTEFCYECLFHPTSVITDNNDLQLLQFKEYILQYIEKINIEQIPLLDYGAGKGRILSFLRDTYSSSNIVKNISYYAFDKFKEDKEICEGIITEVYENTDDNRYYNDFNILKEQKACYFDIVLLANVLHEIPVTEWNKLFSEDLISILSDKGIIIILENSEMLHGEYANKFGFLAVNSKSLEILFENDNINCISKEMDIPGISLDKRDRVQAHVVTKDDLLRVSNITVLNMLKSIIDGSKIIINDIRFKGNKDLIQAKRLSFYYQQFASASIAFEEITTGEKTKFGTADN